jgi:hypothetical protein
VESGLPILNDFNTGRGQREKKRKRLNLPGESTTEVESEEELGSQSTRKADIGGKMLKKSFPRKPSIVKPTSTLPKPPAGLRVSKGKTLKEVQLKEVGEEKASNAQQLKPGKQKLKLFLLLIPNMHSHLVIYLVNASNIHSSTSEESSSRNVDLTIQPLTQPGNGLFFSINRKIIFCFVFTRKHHLSLRNCGSRRFIRNTALWYYRSEKRFYFVFCLTFVSFLYIFHIL